MQTEEGEPLNAPGAVPNVTNQPDHQVPNREGATGTDRH